MKEGVVDFGEIGRRPNAYRKGIVDLGEVNVPSTLLALASWIDVMGEDNIQDGEHSMKQMMEQNFDPINDLVFGCCSTWI